MRSFFQSWLRRPGANSSARVDAATLTDYQPSLANQPTDSCLRLQKYVNNIIKGGCSNLSKRLYTLLDIVESDNVIYVEKYTDAYKVRIEETNGLGKLLEQVCVMIYPKVPYITAELIYHTKILTIHITGKDSREMLLNTIKKCILIYKHIQTQIPS